MSFSRCRPIGRSIALLAIASCLLAYSPARAESDLPEDSGSQAERSDDEGVDDSAQEDGRQSRSATKKEAGDPAEDAADSEEVESTGRLAAPAEEPSSEDTGEPSKPAQADAAPAAPPQKPVASERALSGKIQGKDATKAEEAPSVTPSRQTAQPAPEKSSSDATPPSAPQHDVYSERTDKLLQAESKQIAEKVHPIELRYPDHNVIVCTAGCGPGGTVVHKRAKSERGLVETAVMVPSAASASTPPAAASDNTMTCLAGCFTTPKKLRAVEKRADLVTMNAPAAAAAAPSAASPAAIADKLSGKWTSAPASAEKSAATPAVAPKSEQPRQMGSGDWMGRINKDGQ